MKRIPEETRIQQINAMPNISFVSWHERSFSSRSRVVVRCNIDGYEWAPIVKDLLIGRSGCAQCSGVRHWTAEERISQINSRQNISFVRWIDEYKGSHSKVICRCTIDGYEWMGTVGHIANSHRGCPKCAKTGYDPSKSGTLYVLRSECGAIVKIGISNDYKTRHTTLRRTTPFNWSCIELLHSDDGSLIAELEKELHSWTAPVEFSEPFDGYTEWRKWDDRIPMWIEEYRARA